MLSKRTKRQHDTIVVPEGFFQELYTPTAGRIISPGLGIELEYARMHLAAAGTVTWKDTGGNLVTSFTLQAGDQKFLVREIITSSVAVLIIHDGVPSVTTGF